MYLKLFFSGNNFILKQTFRFKYKRIWPQEYDRVYKPALTQREIESYEKLKKFPKIKESIEPFNIEKFRRLYPELIPHNLDPRYRDQLRERLERHEMLLRRRVINLPEFYAGSILHVVKSEPDSANKMHSFTGICIIRHNEGLWSRFTLRNVIDKTPVEIEYQLYNPTIQSIKVLLLERRLDDNLLYLRDAPLAESRVPLNMTPVPHPVGEPVPINPKKVPLLPRPWLVEWHLHGYRGIDEESMYRHVPPKELASLHLKLPLVDRYDLMKKYRNSASLYEENRALRQVFDNSNESSDFLKEQKHEANFRKKKIVQI